jgi:hypothetical protein
MKDRERDGLTRGRAFLDPRSLARHRCSCLHDERRAEIGVEQDDPGVRQEEEDRGRGDLPPEEAGAFPRGRGDVSVPDAIGAQPGKVDEEEDEGGGKEPDGDELPNDGLAGTGEGRRTQLAAR